MPSPCSSTCAIRTDGAFSTSTNLLIVIHQTIWILYQFLVSLYKCFKMARNTSILLGEYFEDFISSEVSSGKYSSASEVVRTALRLLQLEESKKKTLAKALQQGEKSGFVKNFDAKSNLKKLRGKIQ